MSQLDFTGDLSQEELEEESPAQALRYGDVISLFAEGYVSGFLSSVSMIDDRCVVQPLAGNTERPPLRFRDCLFEVQPTSRYSAQQEYRKALQQTTTFQDVVLLTRLKNAAEAEKQQNEEDKVKQCGSTVLYGHDIQLLHCMSQKYLSVNKTLPALLEKQAMRVSLESEGSEGCYLTLMPFYNISSPSEPVTAESRIVLMAPLTESALHASNYALGDHENSLEVNIGPEKTCWQLNTFLPWSPFLRQSLKGGDVIRLFHCKQEKFLTADQRDNQMIAFLRTTGRTSKATAISSQALWEVEVVQENPCCSGVGMWDSFFRLKHLATSQYLTVHEDADVKYCLSMTDTKSDVRNLFEFVPVNAPLHKNRIGRDAYIRLRNLATGLTAHSSDVAIDIENEKPIMQKVAVGSSDKFEEAFAVVPVDPDEVYDLDYATEASQVLVVMIENIKNDNLTVRILKMGIKVLGSLIAFVLGLSEADASDPLAMTGKPNRARQKLVREQSCVENIFNVLELIYHNDASKEQSTDRRSGGIKEFSRMGYRLIRLSFENYRKNQEYVTKWLGFMQGHIGREILVEEAITALLNGNKKLTESYVKRGEIEVFVQLLQQTRKPEYLQYLTDLCACNGEVIKRTQGLICDLLLGTEHDEVLLRTSYSSDGSICVTWKDFEGAEQERTVFELVSTSSAARERAQKDAASDLLEFYRLQIELYSAMCRGRNTTAIHNISQRLPLELCKKGLADPFLPPGLRAAFSQTIIDVYIIIDTSKECDPIQYARLWQDVGLSFDLPDYVIGNPKPDMTDLKVFIHEFANHLTKFPEDFDNQSRSQLTLAVVSLFKNLVKYGHYSLSEMMRTVAQLLDIFARRTQIFDVPDALAPETPGEQGPDSPRPIFMSHPGLLQSKSLSHIRLATRGKQPSFVGITASLDPDPTSMTQQKVISEFMEVLEFVLDVRIDFRISQALVAYKRHALPLLNDEPEGFRRTADAADYTADYHEIATTATKDLEKSSLKWAMFLKDNLRECREVLEGEFDDLDVRNFIIVLLNEMVAGNNDANIASAMRVFLRYFNERTHLKDSLKQVQLLVSNRDVHIFKEIRNDLDSVRAHSEKIRLTTGIGPEPTPGAGLRQIAPDIEHYRALQGVMERLYNHLVKENVLGASSTQIQRLMRNLGVHRVIMEVLKLPLKHRKERNELLSFVHRALEAFMWGNPLNQRVVYDMRDVLFRDMEEGLEAAHLSIHAMYAENRDLCQSIEFEEIQRIVSSIQAWGRETHYLKILEMFTGFEGEPFKNQQEYVARALAENEEVQLFYDDDNAVAFLGSLHHARDEGLKQELEYHLQLLRVLAKCCKGDHNTKTELICQAMLPHEDVVRVLVYDQIPFDTKSVYMDYLHNSFFASGVGAVQIYSSPAIWHWFQYATDSIARFIDQERRRHKSVGENVCTDRPQNDPPHMAYIFRSLIGPLSDFLKRGDDVGVLMFFSQRLGNLRALLKLILKLRSMKHYVSVYRESLLDEIVKAGYDIAQSIYYPATIDAEQHLGLSPRATEELAEIVGTSVSARSAALKVANHIMKLVRQRRKRALTEAASKVGNLQMQDIMDSFRRFVSYIDTHLTRGESVENLSVLLIFAYPDQLIYAKSFVKSQMILEHLIGNCKKFKGENLGLTVKILQLLREYVYLGEKHEELLDAARYMQRLFNDGAVLPVRGLEELQNELNVAGAMSMIVDLVIANDDHRIFVHAIQCCNALLDEGNPNMQKSFARRCADGSGEPFLRIMNDTLDQQTVRAQKKNLRGTIGDQKGHDLSTDIVHTEEILRFLQLLCENHNPALQNFLRQQSRSRASYNLIHATLRLLDALCGPTSAGMGSYINEEIITLVNQCLITLTEFCQGPCPQNQLSIATHDSRGLDSTIAIILNDINPIEKDNPAAVLELREHAILLLLSLVESRNDKVVAYRVTIKMDIKLLLDRIESYYTAAVRSNRRGRLEIGHNMYILARSLADIVPETRHVFLEEKSRESLRFFAMRTGQIEIVRKGIIENVIFPIPEVCKFLTQESMEQLVDEAQEDEDGSLVSYYYDQFDRLYREMRWQQRIQGHRRLYFVAQQAKTWKELCFFVSVVFNCLILCYYPLEDFKAPTLLQDYIDDDYLVTSLIPMLSLAQLVVAVLVLASYMINQWGIQKASIYQDYALYYYVGQVTLCLAGLLVNPLFFSLMLLDLIVREETLRNVIRSVTKNGLSIFLTGVLGIILIYLFSIVGHLLFKEDFVVMTDDGDAVPACDSLGMCMITALNLGIRSGGGIGDILKIRHNEDPLYAARIIYDITFFFFIIIVVLNMIFGVILDTFADLRQEKTQTEEKMQNTCFVCGLNRSRFENQLQTFEEHCNVTHCKWNYLYFVVHLWRKESTEYTGPESYVSNMLAHRSLHWIPRLRTSLLETGSKNAETDAIELREQVVKMQDTLVKLSTGLSDIYRSFNERRHHARKARMTKLATGSYLNISRSPSVLSELDEAAVPSLSLGPSMGSAHLGVPVARKNPITRTLSGGRSSHSGDQISARTEHSSGHQNDVDPLAAPVSSRASYGHAALERKPSLKPIITDDLLAAQARNLNSTTASMSSMYDPAHATVRGVQSTPDVGSPSPAIVVDNDNNGNVETGHGITRRAGSIHSQSTSALRSSKTVTVPPVNIATKKTLQTLQMPQMVVRKRSDSVWATPPVIDGSALSPMLVVPGSAAVNGGGGPRSPRPGDLWSESSGDILASDDGTASVDLSTDVPGADELEVPPQ
eukprot:Clim_evm11s55 gene=Clim_evmTU11s55